MISFIQAHGYDPGPTARPVIAGAIAGLLAALPAAPVLIGFGSFEVAADALLGLPRPIVAGLLLAAFSLAGLAYGAVFRRAADDRRAGWLLGISFGFVLWVLAPILSFPLLRGAMAAGLAASGFLAAFLVWGLSLGILFPHAHKPLRARLDSAREDTNAAEPRAHWRRPPWKTRQQ